MNGTVTRGFRKKEDEFLKGLEENLRSASARLLPGRRERVFFDFAEDLRAELIDRRVYDQDVIDSLPLSRGFSMFHLGWSPLHGGGYVRSILTVSVLAPPRLYLDHDRPDEVGCRDFLDHLNRVVVSCKTPQCIVVFSPSGFEQDVEDCARMLVPKSVSLVLVDEHWKVLSLDRSINPALLALFDPSVANREGAAQAISELNSQLLTGGVTIQEVAECLEVPSAVAVDLVHAATEKDRELHVSTASGVSLLYRGAPEAKSHRLFARLGQSVRLIVSKDARLARKVNHLSEVRVLIARRRDEALQQIDLLENEEQDLLSAGAATTSVLDKRRAASKIREVRSTLRRQRNFANVYGQQLDILGTHIFHLQTSRVAREVALPSMQELTAVAASTQEMMDELSSMAALANVVDHLPDDSTEEAAILRELSGEGGEVAENRVVIKMPEPDAPRALSAEALSAE